MTPPQARHSPPPPRSATVNINSFSQYVDDLNYSLFLTFKPNCSSQKNKRRVARRVSAFIHHAWGDGFAPVLTLRLLSRAYQVSSTWNGLRSILQQATVVCTVHGVKWCKQLPNSYLDEPRYQIPDKAVHTKTHARDGKHCMASTLSWAYIERRTGLLTS